MPSTAADVLILAGSYLVGAVPFGYLIGLSQGVNLFAVGSGNIGATNVGRTLGPAYGVLCFVLDFLKGAGPVWAAAAVGGSDLLRVGAAAVAFLGHLFPVYLGFRGGKGVATGAGSVAALAPGPTAVAALAWAAVALASRYVSLASVAAVAALSTARLVAAPAADPITLYVLGGSLAVAAKHRANVRRLLSNTENRIGDRPMRHTLLKMLYLLAVGTWCGGAAFFNFGTALPIFDSFKKVVADGPSDRTAYVEIVPATADDETKKNLANALAGAAVGPVFPRYFAMQAVCGTIALITALGWWHAPGRVHRWRVGVIASALLLVAVGWPISNEVSELRVKRFAPDPAVAAAARDAFGPTHLVSLGLSVVTVGLAGVGLALGAKLPDENRPQMNAGERRSEKN